jgi:uncharacterized protein YciI
MKFAASIEYTPDKAKIEQVRPLHRKYLTGLLQQGKLAAAGPFMDDSGALIVYEAETAEQAEALLKADPFRAGGVFVRWTIKPWKTVFGKRDLFPDGGPPPI